MQEFFIKSLRCFFLTILFLVLLFTLTINILLSVFKDKINQLANHNFTYKISITNIFYIFPGWIYFKNIEVARPNSSLSQQSFHIPTILAKFSLVNLVTKRQVLIPNIVLSQPKINYFAFRDFLKEDYYEILRIIKSLPKADINIRIPKTQLDIAPLGETPNYAFMDFSFKLKGNTILGDGSYHKEPFFGKTNAIGKGRPLQFHFKGYLTPAGLSFDKLILKRENFYTNFWGALKGNHLHLNGYAFINTKNVERKYQRNTSNLIRLLTFFLQGFKKQSETAIASNLSVIDIDGEFVISLPQVQIEQLKLKLNYAPISIAGSISLSDPLALDLAISFSPEPKKQTITEILKRADLKFSGKLLNHSLDTDGTLSFDFMDRPDSSNSPDHVEINFRELNLLFDIFSRLKIHLGEGKVSFWTNGNEHRISLENLKAYFNFLPDQVKFAEIFCPFYNGQLRGRVWFDLSQAQLPIKITGLALLENVDAHQLDELLIHFSKVHGQLFSKINFQSDPHFDFSGTLHIVDGNLKNFDFFQWMAETFNLPALQSISFPEIMAQFSINTENVGLTNIHLATNDVGMNGYYIVDKNSLISSKLSLSLSRNLLHESPKFKPVHNMFDKNTSSLTFDFQLSGDQHAMNFQWLDNEYKRRIQDKIPDFIERRIERRVDESIKPAEPAPKTK